MRGNKNSVGSHSPGSFKPGHVVTKEMRLKIGLAKIGNTYSVGRRLSAKTKAKISKTRKKNYKLYGHKGHKLTLQTRRKISMRLRDNKNFSGHEHSQAVRKKLSLAKQKFYRNLSPKKRSELARTWARSQRLKPNAQETKLNKLVQEAFPKQFRLNVQGAVVLGGKIPDFVNVNGRKALIELFGDYWHSKKITGRSAAEEEKSRKKAFAKYGFKTAIIWEHELRNEKLVLGKIKRALED